MPMQIPETEYAVRAGILTVLNKSNQSGSSDFAKDGLAMVSTAQDHMQMYVKSNGAAASVSDLISEHMDLVKLTVQGVVLAYTAICNQLETLNELRKNFEEELQLNMAFFTIPGQLEAMDLSIEQHAIVGFFKKLEKYPALFAYSGVKLIQQEEDSRTKRYCALPLYAMNHLKHPIASPRPLDEARIAINLLFHSKAIQTMQKMADDFRTDYKIVAFFKSMYEKQNYLNSLRAPRLILTVLFNILWSIQHPIDVETGYSLTLNENIRLCFQFKNLLNIYLADRTMEGPYKINKEDTDLQRMLLHIELRTNKLHYGFIDEKLRQFNLKDLTNSAHRTLRELDTSLFQLIFSKKNPVTGICYPDRLAAADIADTISILNELMNKNPIFLTTFNEECKKIPTTSLARTYLNPHVKTIIDVLIVFFHLTGKQRSQLIVFFENYLEAGEDGVFLARELSKFNQYYIKPIEEINEKLIKNAYGDTYLTKVSKRTAAILTALCTLVVADYKIDVDRRKTTELHKGNEENQNASLYFSGKEQVQLINDSAQAYSQKLLKSDLNDATYHWALSPYLTLTPKAAESIDSLPSKQYRMTQITELLDYINELTQNYRSFLQFKSFQAFLLECLQYVSSEYAQFAEEAMLVEQYLSLDGLLDRTLKDVLLTMVSKLSDNLLTFRQTIDEVTHLVGSPDFTELRKHELTKQVQRIEKKFTQLFGREPVNFINTYQRILSQVDMAPIRVEKTEKIKKLYLFSKDFLTETQKTLIASQPNLPKAPSFLCQLKKEKLAKYLKLIALAILHIEGLVADDNFLLDPYELFRQLQLIDVNQTLNRKEDKIKHSTFCQVIIEELKKRFSQQTIKLEGAPNIQLAAPSTSVQPEPITRVGANLFSSPSPFRRLSANPAPSSSNSLAPPNIETSPLIAEESNERKTHRVFIILKNELKKVLEAYIEAKIQERPTHWFYLIVEGFKAFFAQYFNFIKEQLLETKLQVAQKVVDSLDRIPEDNFQLSHPRLTLTNSELNTLSQGTLGSKTLFFRENSFWSSVCTSPGSEIKPADGWRNQNLSLTPDRLRILQMEPV